MENFVSHEFSINQALAMAQIVEYSIHDVPSLKFARYSEYQEGAGAAEQWEERSGEARNKLEKLVKKHRQEHYINTFCEKIRRNNIHQPPAHFELQVDDHRKRSFLHFEGYEIRNKSVESFIFAGDIVFSIIIFYIAVFQTFLEGFRANKSSSSPVILLKVVSVAFEFSKILLKSVKKDIVNGKLLTYVDDIIWYSTGVFELMLYTAAIVLIILTIACPLNHAINVAAFLVATVKLFKIPINLNVLDLHYINSQRRQCYWNLIKIVIFELIFMHFVAAVLLALPALNPELNWLTVHGLSGSPWDVQYFWAMYWSATLVTTTGFGDYTANNTKEALIVAFLELFSSVVLVYNLNLIGTIVMNLRESDQNMDKKLATFRRMTDEAPISTSLQQKIHSCIEQENEINQNFEFNDRKKFLDELPQQLKLQYLNDINKRIFSMLPFFRNLRLQTLNNLAVEFTSKVCYPGQNLVPCKQDANGILILKRGEICYQFRKYGATFMNGSIVEARKTLNTREPNPLLLSSTFLNRTRKLNFEIRAHDYSLIMSLSQEKFMETIRRSSIEKEHFFTIYDKHEANFIFEATMCDYCSQEYHSKFECPRLHFAPFKSETIRRFLLQASKKQPRIRCLKTTKRKEHCYYLRKDYYRAYEGYKNIMVKHVSPAIINRLIRMKTLAEQFDRQDLLESFESMFRKVINRDQGEAPEGPHNLDVDAAHNFLSYFAEANPKELDMRQVRKKVKALSHKLSHKLTMLAVSSKKNLYRPLNEFENNYSEDEQLWITF